jgi:hypothetical protein
MATSKKRLRTGWSKKEIKEAIDYWSQRVDEGDLGCDWAEADKRCWRCGSISKFQRCHIVPHSLGGPDANPNLIPLCARCHLEQPDVSDPQATWDWIASTRPTFSGTLYYLRDVVPQLVKVCEDSGLDKDQVDRALKVMGQLFPTMATMHFAPWGTHIKTSTYEHILRAAIEITLSQDEEGILGEES